MIGFCDKSRLAFLAAAALVAYRPVPVCLALTRGQIEADWFRQEQVRRTPSASSDAKVTPEQDAIGACDGVKNGEWGFHTANEANPWWQIDLGTSVALGRMVLYNRCDLAERASRLMILVSDDAENFRQVYQHDGSVFFGDTDKKPLVVRLGDIAARYVRLQLPGKSYFHLDEVEIYPRDSARNIAPGKQATQSSTSQWSAAHQTAAHREINCDVAEVVRRGLNLARDLQRHGVNVDHEMRILRSAGKQAAALAGDYDEEAQRRLYVQARHAVRLMAFANPLLDFDSILFVKRAPGTLPHMSDQYYGWWSRPGGGVYVLEGFKSENPRIRCLTADWPAGSFLRPDLSFDGNKVLFAYCRHYPHVAGMEKVDKDKLPEDAFYQVFEMNVDGTDVRQLTRGRYDDFDARYLPNGDILFLSTRKGQFVQCTAAGVSSTLGATLPDSYVRCGGDNKRPCAVFTLHAMGAEGRNLRPISAFENFEWMPSVAGDGRILYARWDYIDRFNGHLMSLWSTNQDGTNPQLVYGNYTIKPQCIFEARSIPNSSKLVFTASAHHSITGGSLALLERDRGTEGSGPVTRLTPEVCFPEAEGWPAAYYANPYPLSEDYFLVAWSDRRLPPHRGSQQVVDDNNPVNALALYLYDSFGNLELIHRDPDISSMYPIPVRARKRPPAQPDNVAWDAPQQGCFLVQDVYEGLQEVERGSIKGLRVIGVPPKTQPHMNSPRLGVSREDPGKFVIGTIPVEPDGSAYFHVPSGVPVFFQAIDEKGLAVQTMRSLTYVQPGQTLSCVGCHESRELAPISGGRPSAVKRQPSRIAPGPEGSWPLRFDRLVQPVIDELCVSCHRPDGDDEKAARFALTIEHSYENLLSYADKDLEKLAFERDASVAGQCVAGNSRLLALLTEPQGHAGVQLDADSCERLVTWMDVYAQELGSFSADQERQLYALRERLSPILAE